MGEALFYLPSHPSMYLSICSFIHSSSCHLPTCALSIHRSSQPASPAFTHLSFYPSFYPPIYPFVCPPPPSIHLIIRPPSISPSLSANFDLSFPSCVRPSIHPSTHMHICPSVCPAGAGCQRRVRESWRTWWGQRVGPQHSQTLPGSVFLLLTAQLLPGTTSCHHRPPDEWLPLPHPPAQSGASRKTEVIADPPGLWPRPQGAGGCLLSGFGPVVISRVGATHPIFRHSPGGHRGDPLPEWTARCRAELVLTASRPPVSPPELSAG